MNLASFFGKFVADVVKIFLDYLACRAQGLVNLRGLRRTLRGPRNGARAGTVARRVLAVALALARRRQVYPGRILSYGIVPIAP